MTRHRTVRFLLVAACVVTGTAFSLQQLYPAEAFPPGFAIKTFDRALGTEVVDRLVEALRDRDVEVLVLAIAESEAVPSFDSVADAQR